MRKRNIHIHRFLTVLMLVVFSMAIVPWNMLHGHGNAMPRTADEQHCTHKEHFKVYQDKCLICNAHFEKSYTLQKYPTVLILEKAADRQVMPVFRTSYTALISTSLRGPPAFA